MIADLVNLLIRMMILAFLAIAVMVMLHLSFYAMTTARDFICSH